MAITPYGFDGSLDEAKWATMWQLGTTANHVLGTNDFRVTAVAGFRQVSVGTGTAFSRGVLAINDTAVPLALTPPTAGQWWLIALAVDWNANTVTPVALPGATTTTTTPVAIPTSFPTGYTTSTGSTAHSPLAWVWTSANSTSLIIVDVRTRNPQYLNQGIWGPYGSVPTGPAGARDLWFNVSTNNASVAGRNYLQGALWYNNDTDRLERWYGQYSGSNPGGASTPGWYPATPYDNYNDGVSSSDYAAGIRCNAGSAATAATYNVTVSIPTWVMVRTDLNITPNTTSNTNTAGTISLRVNGSDMDGGKRFHTHGTTGNTVYQMSVTHRVLLTPGTNVLQIRIGVDSSSGAAMNTAEGKIVVWRE